MKEMCDHYHVFKQLTRNTGRVFVILDVYHSVFWQVLLIDTYLRVYRNDHNHPLGSDPNTT